MRRSGRLAPFYRVCAADIDRRAHQLDDVHGILEGRHRYAAPRNPPGDNAVSAALAGGLGCSGLLPHAQRGAKERDRQSPAAVGRRCRAQSGHGIGCRLASRLVHEVNDVQHRPQPSESHRRAGTAISGWATQQGRWRGSSGARTRSRRRRRRGKAETCSSNTGRCSSKDQWTCGCTSTRVKQRRVRERDEWGAKHTCRTR